MPDLPPGPLQDLIRELHALHLRAGHPSARELRLAVGGTVSHTKIHHAFSKPVLPSWGVLDVVVEQLAIRARPRTDAEAEINRFKLMWDRASEQVHQPTALHEAAASVPRYSEDLSTAADVCLPIYLAVDTSFAMADHIETVNECEMAVYDALYTEPALAPYARLSVVSFNEDAYLVLPLTEVNKLESLPTFGADGPTRYRPMLTLVHEQADRDAAALRAGAMRVLDPVICVITSGGGTDIRLKPVLPGEHPAHQVVAYGFAGADRDTLASLGTTAAYAAEAAAAPDRAWSAIADNLATALAEAPSLGRATFPIYTAGLVRLR